MRTIRHIVATPILRLVVQKLTEPGKVSKVIITADKYILGNRIAETIVKTDQFVQGQSALRHIFSSDLEVDLQGIRPFLNEELIADMMSEILPRERLTAQLPKPGGCWENQQKIQALLDEHNKRVDEAKQGLAQELTRSGRGLP